MSLVQGISLTCSVVVGAIALSMARSSAPVVADAAAAGPGSRHVSTLDQQVDLALTVYNSNLALVRDVRELGLPPGEFDLHFGDIAATVNPATVHLRSLGGGSGLTVLEQNYEYDLLEPAKLLDKYVGRTVTLVRTRNDNGTTREDSVRATLVANNTGPIWRVGDEIVTGMGADHLRFPELPENLFVRPTLVWKLAGGSGGTERVEATYQAANVSWSADYVLTVARDDAAADLNGWVTLTNRSGTTFRQARLQLVAGDLNRVTAVPQADGMAMEMARPAAASAMQQEAFSEYHLYTFGRRTTIANKETKQLSLLSASRVPVSKEFVVQGGRNVYRGAFHSGSPYRTPVQVFYRFKNQESAGLGVPMPAGTVRVYQADSRGALQFAGEDRIGHTPKDEEVSFRIGTAFDIICERKQTSWEKLGDSLYEGAYEVVLRNRKASAVTVRVEEAIGASWQMLQASHTWTKPDAWSARFDVPVEAGGTATVKYKVRIRH
jgi:hypothetical protein